MVYYRCNKGKAKSVTSQWDRVVHRHTPLVRPTTESNTSIKQSDYGTVALFLFSQPLIDFKEVLALNLISYRLKS